MGSTVCKVCGLAPETANHIIIQCPIAKEVWLHLWSWMKIPIRSHDEDIRTRIQEKSEWPRNKVKIIFAIHLLAGWHLWKNRNNKAFNDALTNPGKLAEEIKEEAFDWIKLRSRHTGITWLEWRNFTFWNVPP
ncbi:uncharacterized protein LOC110892727 [Helianthus annuus]|uniref:uncharacterized protein LOC110892727 n=1 Tax=Helianthus annuus TaxID=4232 RepID=UPI000B8FBE13|nr:uncharacterized protein LOC110892727 [Helianthus annuus]